MFPTNFGNPNTSMQEEVELLREDATQTARDIIEGVQENFVTNDNFTTYHHKIEQKLNELSNNNANIMTLINNISQRLDLRLQDDQEVTPRGAPEDFVSLNTSYDLDHDVIMRSRISVPLNQVPEPGFFSGKTSETDLFCQLCEDTFKTMPNRSLPEDAKVNFVKSRLRDSARNWYLTKYKDNINPGTMEELLNGLRTAFSNAASYKLAKIKLITLKQEYGKINNYIEEFRSYSRQFNWEEEALALIFYNGLHQKYQEEIQKMDTFPTTLESIITTCILFENTINTKNKLHQENSRNYQKRKSSRSNYGYNNTPKSYKNNYGDNYNRNYNNNYHNNNNNYNNNHNNRNQKFNNDNNYNNYKSKPINSKN